MRRRSVLVALPFVVWAGACTPYAVSTTALPMARGAVQRTTTLAVVPGGAEWSGDSAGARRENVAMPGLDMEQRVGLDERSDIGVRIPSFSGVIVTYKRRLDGPTSRDARATAIMVGGGFVNFGQHAHGEVTLITSGRESASVVPYGGFRAIQILPLSNTAVHDTPAVGAFAGLKLGGRTSGVSAEVGVFHDRSALELRRGTIIVVPSVAFHGSIVQKLMRW
jgi:hypothetical protein